MIARSDAEQRLIDALQLYDAEAHHGQGLSGRGRLALSAAEHLPALLEKIEQLREDGRSDRQLRCLVEPLRDISGLDPYDEKSLHRAMIIARKALQRIGEYAGPIEDSQSHVALERTRAAVAAERDRCAAIADDVGERSLTFADKYGAARVAAAIREDDACEVYRVHIAGPDDVHEFGSELEALRFANAANLTAREHGDVMFLATAEAIKETQ